MLRYARPGNQANVRAHALGFLLAITARPDGADLLSSKSEEISSLLSDVDPNIQTSIAGTIDILMMQPATNTKPYVVALTAAIQDRRTPQDVIVERMIPPLLTYGRDDPRVAAAALAFVHRGDLTASTRSALVNTLSSVPDLPEGVNRYLVERLDDSDPHVRGVAVVAYPDSTTAYHAAAKGRVERMATDPREDPRVRELAKEAIEGKTSSNPNIDLPPYTQHDR